MHADALISGDGQHTQVGANPLDYVLRYAAGDYDCFFQGRYIGSRSTLPKAIAAVEEVQAKAARHPQLFSVAESPIAIYQDELHALAARLHDLADRLASHPSERIPAANTPHPRAYPHHPGA